MAEYGRVGQAGDYMSGAESPILRGGNTPIPTVRNRSIGKGDGTYRHDPISVTVNIEIKYDPASEDRPFQYLLTFPGEMKEFFYEAGLTLMPNTYYTGDSTGYDSADSARSRAESEATRVINRYKKHQDNKAQATKYAYTVEL